MRFDYKLIKKIHLYACLSTVAVLVMFIITSYLMIHHISFNHTVQKEERTVSVEDLPTTANQWKEFENQFQIKGRLTREGVNQDGQQFREYASASGSTRVIYESEQKQVVFVRNIKSKADAIIGIHRQRGYDGSLQYKLYALLLDIVALSLIAFTLTGIILWFKLLKNNRFAWVIFIGGLMYVCFTMLLLIYW